MLVHQRVITTAIFGNFGEVFFSLSTHGPSWCAKRARTCKVSLGTWRNSWLLPLRVWRPHGQWRTDKMPWVCPKCGITLITWDNQPNFFFDCIFFSEAIDAEFRYRDIESGLRASLKMEDLDTPYNGNFDRTVWLVGGLEHFLFSRIVGMMIQSDFHIF